MYESEFLDQLSIAVPFYTTATVLLSDNGQMHLTTTQGLTEIRPRYHVEKWISRGSYQGRLYPFVYVSYGKP